MSEVSGDIGDKNVNLGIFTITELDRSEGLDKSRKPRMSQHLELTQHLDMGMMRRIQRGD